MFTALRTYKEKLMADINKIEAMLEKLVNEDKAGAEELFHEYVIEKSREIYENLLEDDLDIDEASKDEEVDEASDEEVDEASKDEEVDEASKEDDKEVDESSKDDEVEEATDEKEVEEATDDEKTDENFMEPEMEAPMDDMGGDPADDMMGDIEAGDDEEGDDMGDEGEEELEDRVVDLEDALDDLKAEFEKMMGDEDKGDDEAGDDMDMDAGDDEGDAEEEALVPAEEFAPMETSEDEVEESVQKTATEQMREYVEKVAEPKGEDNKAKSPVASKNDMGGTASNIAQGGDESGGKAQAPKEDNAGNVNVPGGKASKSMSKNAKGHGTEKKGAGETGVNAKSTIGS